LDFCKRFLPNLLINIQKNRDLSLFFVFLPFFFPPLPEEGEKTTSTLILPLQRRGRMIGGGGYFSEWS